MSTIVKSRAIVLTIVVLIVGLVVGYGASFVYHPRANQLSAQLNGLQSKYDALSVQMTSLQSKYDALIAIQPNIQLTKEGISRSIQYNPAETVYHSIVLSSDRFSYTANQSCLINLDFTNYYGEVSTVTMTYSVTGRNETTESFKAGGQYGLQGFIVDLPSGQTVSGSLVTTKTTHGVDFKISRQLGRQTVNISFTPVNTGGSNGYATVALQADGKVVWTKTYYVQIGQQTQYRETASIPNLDPHQYSLVVVAQSKCPI